MKRVLFAFAVALPLVVMGCGKEEPLPQHQGSSTPSPADTGTYTPTQTTATTATETVATPPVAGTVPPTGNVIVTTEGEKADVRIDVTQFKRDAGDTVTLRFTVVNNSTENLAFSSYWLGDHSLAQDYYSIGGIQLIDPINKKKYFVVRDTDKNCLCSNNLREYLKPGSKINLWAKFPAPPPGVQRLSIVIPHFTPIDDVPLP